MDPKWAKPWFAVTALCVVAGIVIQLFISAQGEEFFGGSPWGRAINVFAFFTILSNVIVGITSGMLAMNQRRWSTVFAAARLTGVIAIAVTFLVFHVTLSRLLDLDTWGQAANQLQHTVVPILAVVGWIAFGPRGLTSARIVKLTVIFPLLYMVFTAIRGPLVGDWYPYPFADVAALGYLRVAINALWVALLFLALAAGANALDAKLGGDRLTLDSDESS